MLEIEWRIKIKALVGLAEWRLFAVTTLPSPNHTVQYFSYLGFHMHSSSMPWQYPRLDIGLFVERQGSGTRHALYFLNKVLSLPPLPSYQFFKGAAARGRYGFLVGSCSKADVYRSGTTTSRETFHLCELRESKFQARELLFGTE